MFVRLVLLLSLLPTLSCGSSDDSGLAIAISPSENFLLPGDLEINDDCYGTTDEEGNSDPEVFTENHLTFQNITTQWTGDGTFLPIVIGITLVNGTDEQECTLSGPSSDSFGTFLGFEGDELDNSEGEGVEVESICEIRCGGFDADPGTIFNTRIQLIGIQTTTDDEGNEIQKPVSASTTVTVDALEL